MVEITHAWGLHARAAARVVEVASRFRSDIALVFEGRRASARSIVAVMLLAVAMGGTIRIEAEGEDEMQAAEALSTLIREDFGLRR
jgi:phosphocarrier protein